MELENIRIDCTIFPNENKLEAEVIIDFSNIKTNIQLLLNPDLQWKQIEVKGKEGWLKVDPEEKELSEQSFYKIGKLWQITIPSVVSESFQSDIQIRASYEGKVTKANWDLGGITNDFVELNSYSLWYPILEKVQKHSFEIQLKSPNNWSWVSNGKLVSKELSEDHLHRFWKSSTKDHDAVLLGVPTEDAYHKEGSILFGRKEIIEENNLYEEALLERKQAMEEWLGKPRVEGDFIYAFTPRERGGQYSRNNFISTVRKLPSDNEMVPRVLQSILHEISHFWWNKTSVETFHNWLDEALAEYTSSLIISEKFGGDSWLKKRTERVLKALEKESDLPPIRNTPRSHKNAYTIFYYRGFLLFWDLHQKIGTQMLKEIIKEFALVCNDNDDAITTLDFLAILGKYSQKSGFNLVMIINRWLDCTKGERELLEK